MLWCPLQSSLCPLKVAWVLAIPSSSLFLRRVYPFFIDKSLQFPLSDKGFNLLLQVIAFKCVVIVIPMKTTILVSRPPAGISLQLARTRQGCIVLYLHQYLIHRGNQWGEVCEPSRGDLEHLSSYPSPVLVIFHPLSCHASSCLSLFLGFSPWAGSASSAFMYLVAR